MQSFVKNPYRPGAGQIPPYFAGRDKEITHFRRLLAQSFSSENVLITGLRGFGKTVLLDHLKDYAQAERWLWVGNDLSESSSLSEERLALRIITDISQALNAGLQEVSGEGQFDASGANDDLNAAPSPSFDALKTLYETAPGLPSDKLRAVVMRVNTFAKRAGYAGIILAYDEAQCLSDHAERDQFPMSMLVETVASMQKERDLTPMMLVLSGLPHVFDALIATRTYTERMFHVMRLERLGRQETVDAISRPLLELMPPLHPTNELVLKAADLSGGYPYLIQFFGKELVDHMITAGGVLHHDQFPSEDVIDRLDAGLFTARWNKTTDRQRELLELLTHRASSSSYEFSAADVVALSKASGSFNTSQATQILHTLCDRGIVFKSRRGRFAFTVPMSDVMIRRRLNAEREDSSLGWDVAHQHAAAQQSAQSAETAPKSGSKLRSWFFGL